MKLYSGLVILVSAIALACGSAPSNNANTNRLSNVNTNVSNMSMSNMSNTANSMMNATSNMMANSAANTKANTSVKSNTSTTNTSSTSSNSTVAGDKKIKGNKATKVYHLPGCPDYDKISAGNVVTFNTESEARAAGYKIAGNCK